MKTIKNINSALYSPIDGLITYRPLPAGNVSMEALNPFIFLNHHGPQKYPPNNKGLPFGPHPHRGMETVTFILEGDIMHKDSNGNESIIKAGGIQWMTAGRGLIHEEVSSDEFKRNGGDLEILQLWLNLPKQNKMMEPYYKGLNKESIPEILLEGAKVKVNLISGSWDNHKGPFNSVLNIHISLIFFRSDTEIILYPQPGSNILFYIIKGELTVNNTKINSLQLIQFNDIDGEIFIRADEESILLYGYAEPLREPIAAEGPFVMNTKREILDAYEDYQNGKFGKWHE